MNVGHFSGGVAGAGRTLLSPAGRTVRACRRPVLDRRARPLIPEAGLRLPCQRRAGRSRVGEGGREESEPAQTRRAAVGPSQVLGSGRGAPIWRPWVAARGVADSRVRPLRTQSTQRDLFEAPDELPAGMRYAPGLISPTEEHELVREVAALPFREFEFHGFLGRRRTVAFGWRYDFNGGGLQQTGEIPEFLLPVRSRAAAFAGLEPSALEHALLIEYAAGAGIGWHRDRPAFDDVIG